MRALPNMTVIAPGDPVEAALATRAIAQRTGPCYLRLARTGDPIVHQTVPDFQVGKAITVRDGRDITLIATGGILWNAVQAAEQLASLGIQARLLSMPTLKPLDVEAVRSAAKETSAVITIEEHNIIGGLGSAVAEVLSESNNSRFTFQRLGIKDCFCSEVGSQAYLQKVYSLSVEGIVNTVKSLLLDKTGAKNSK
jgi:transketolase